MIDEKKEMSFGDIKEFIAKELPQSKKVYFDGDLHKDVKVGMRQVTLQGDGSKSGSVAKRIQMSYKDGSTLA